jgi:TFIIF-interacting CTD phosphatase-like protein
MDYFEGIVWALLLLSLWSLSGRPLVPVSFYNYTSFRNRRKQTEQGSESSDVASVTRLLRSPMKPPRRKKTLVLDLDETLVHSSSRQTYRQDLTVEVMVEKQSLLYYVYQRPHCDYFLEKVFNSMDSSSLGV